MTLVTPAPAAPPRIAFYADDFTGATDTLATASVAGLRAILFLRVPDAALLACVGSLDVLGIAGAARSMDKEAMVAELLPVRDFFTELGARVLHYKTCSTFDSSPAVGSIGTAIACLRPFSTNPLVAIVGGQPNLNRYCLFGNLFATVETGGPVFRIDRHETMSRHPVTPMTEADLRLHLSRQGLAAVASIDYTAYDLDETAFEARLDDVLGTGPDAVLFDIGHPSHLAVVGRTLWQHASTGAPLLAVGASSVAQALIAYWKSQERAVEPLAAEDAASASSPASLLAAWPASLLAASPASSAAAPRVSSAATARVPRPSGRPVLVVAGSLSGVTARQRAAATSYAHVAVDARRLADSGVSAVAPVLAEVVALLRAGRHVLVHTAADDPDRRPSASRLAHETGQLLRHVLDQVPLGRIGIAGGDTSSHAIQALDCWGLSYLGPVAPGVSLCRLHADSAEIHGLEVMLKGGQMGPPDVFERLLANA